MSRSLYPILLVYFFFYSYTHHPDLHSFPTRRSSDLPRMLRMEVVHETFHERYARTTARLDHLLAIGDGGRDRFFAQHVFAMLDRKSTRLNSSHGSISYAVFCLKKKKNNNPSSTYVTT